MPYNILFARNRALSSYVIKKRYSGKEATIVSDETMEMVETPDPCEVTTEYDNRIEDDFVIEPGEEDLDLDLEVEQVQEEIEIEVEPEPEVYSRGDSGEVEQKFARYERNYRARRIRELALAPTKKKAGRPSKSSDMMAA